MYDAQTRGNDHPIGNAEYTVEGGPVKRVRLDEGGMWMKGFGDVKEDDQCIIVECFRKKRSKVKMPKFTQRPTKRSVLRNKEDEIARLRRGMATFLRGVMREGLDDEIEEVMNGVARIGLVECGGDFGSLVEKMKRMNLGGERGGGEKTRIGVGGKRRRRMGQNGIQGKDISRRGGQKKRRN